MSEETTPPSPAVEFAQRVSEERNQLVKDLKNLQESYRYDTAVLKKERDDFKALAICKDETATTFMNQVRKLQEEIELLRNTQFILNRELGRARELLEESQSWAGAYDEDFRLKRQAWIDWAKVAVQDPGAAAEIEFQDLESRLTESRRLLGEKEKQFEMLDIAHAAMIVENRDLHIKNRQLRAAVKANHEWHQEQDEHDAYADSFLRETNEVALALEVPKRLQLNDNLSLQVTIALLRTARGCIPESSSFCRTMVNIDNEIARLEALLPPEPKEKFLDQPDAKTYLDSREGT